MVVTTRRGKAEINFEDCVSKAMDLARRRNVTRAIADFTSKVNQEKPIDFLLLHAAAAVSLSEFENCLRSYHHSSSANSMINDGGMNADNMDNIARR